MPADDRIFKSRFVDELKHKGTSNAFEKSRLAVQAYNDNEKDLVLTQSPTIQRVSQRLLLCVAASMMTYNNHFALYLRDISQAYVQSSTKLNRSFFVRPPEELCDALGLDPQVTILKVVKPYGVPEAGNHWFRTYHNHHTEALKTETSTFDPCLLYAHDPTGYFCERLCQDSQLGLSPSSYRINCFFFIDYCC